MSDDRTDDRVYDALARALARLGEPDLAGIPTESVDLALVRAFTVAGPRPEWLRWLRHRVTEASGGLTVLGDADRARFPAPAKSPAAYYGEVRGLWVQRLVVLGPFRPALRYTAALPVPTTPRSTP